LPLPIQKREQEKSKTTPKKGGERVQQKKETKMKEPNMFDDEKQRSPKKGNEDD
jgi:hypothetical protein